jgi:hypothetical protein
MIGQSAVEYLMTYGWMLLVVAVVGGAVFSVVGGQSIESTSGFTGDDLGVKDFGVSKDGSLKLVLQSKTYETIKIQSITINGTNISRGIGGPELLGSGQEQISIPGIRQTKGTKTLDVKLSYSIGQLDNLAVGGSITGTLDVLNKSSIAYTGKSYSKLNASGGEQITAVINDQKYRIHAFKTVGQSNFTVEEAVNAKIDVLIVAGGGGGGGRHGAGGGAGGLIFKEGYSVSPGNYSVSVGSGGAGGDGSGGSGFKGGDSAFDGLIANGGGAGHGADDSSGTQDGGSGGGTNSYSANTIGKATQPSSSGGGFGKDGGDTVYGSGSPYNHAGGGGAGQKGRNGTMDSPGGGGEGQYYGDIYSDNFGENGYFAGGGGGGSHSPTPDAFVNSGGLGGGGDGGQTPYNTNTDSGGNGNDGEDGLANTGGGGGGGSTDSSSGGGGGDGGSGIVLIRYPIGTHKAS